MASRGLTAARELAARRRSSDEGVESSAIPQSSVGKQGYFSAASLRVDWQ